MQRLGLGFLVVISAIMAATAALAAPVTWTINTTHNGTPAVGTMTVDRGAGTVTGVHLTHGGITYDGGRFHPGGIPSEVILYVTPADPANLRSTRAFLIRLTTDYPLAPSTATIALTATGECNNETCGAFTGAAINDVALLRTITGSVPVPTMSEWALILLGALLAGGAALVLHRRRPVLAL